MYKEKEHTELFDLLERHQELTFQSQRDLRDELSRRGLNHKIEDLDNTILHKESEIRDFKFLKDIGFALERNNDGIKLTRTTGATMTDIAAIVLGFFLPYIGLKGLAGLYAMYQEGGDIGYSFIVSIILYSAIILVSIKFLNGIMRLFDFAGFTITRVTDKIIMKKRFDLKLEEVTANISTLKLEKSNKLMTLNLNGLDILSCNVNNITQKMTIEALYEELSK